MTQVSFPGLFDPVFNINPVAFTVFGREVRWYGLIICIGIILTVMNVARCAHKEGISTDDVLDYALWVVPIGIIGARAYYVLTSLSEYDSFGEAIAIWNGGLAIYGGVIGGAIAAFIVSKVKKQNFLKIADAIGASVFIGQFIGRWGNFCNGEAFGTLEKIDFFGKTIATPGLEKSYFLRMLVNSDSTLGWESVHPTFLYESIWNLIGFLLVTFVIYNRKKFDGQIILFYMSWYGFGRFFIEGLRTDSLYLGNTGIRISQLLALVTFIFGVTATVIMLTKAKKSKLESGEYVSQFGVPENAIGIIPSAEESAQTKEEENTENPIEASTEAEEQDKNSEPEATDAAPEENSTATEENSTEIEENNTTKTENITTTEEKENGTDN